MTKFFKRMFHELTIVACMSAVTFAFPSVFVNSDSPIMTEITTTDRAFVAAITKADKNSTSALLDDNFHWISPAGQTWDKDQILQKLAGLTAGDDGKGHNYGNVVYLTGMARSSSDKIRFVRVWVKESSGWKVLLQQETIVVGKTATTQATVPVGTSCENPCKSIPYEAPSPEAQAVVASWEGLEDAVNHRDADGWASHVADEFVFNVKEDGNPLTKADRVAIIKKQAQGNTVTDIGTVIAGTMNVWLFGDTAVMTDQQQPTKGGDPYQAMRIWVKRDGRWQLVYSQQTVIEHAAGAS
jgi:ketosteroid isomerase-like protein